MTEYKWQNSTPSILVNYDSSLNIERRRERSYAFSTWHSNAIQRDAFCRYVFTNCRVQVAEQSKLEILENSLGSEASPPLYIPFWHRLSSKPGDPHSPIRDLNIITPTTPQGLIGAHNFTQSHCLKILTAFLRSEREMGRVDYLAMKTDPIAATELLNSDINELKIAAKRFIRDATKLGGLGFGTTFLKWVASFAAMWVLFHSLRISFAVCCSHFYPITIFLGSSCCY